MRQALLLVGGLAGLFAIVPLCTWADTGSLRAAWEAAKGYGVVMGILAGLALFGVLAGAIGAMINA